MTLPKLEVGYGLGRGQASFTTGARSATQAMTGVKECPLAAVLVFASVKYDLEAVLQGVYSVVGDVPLIGATTAGEICDGPQQESVVVVPLASPYLKVRVGLGEGVSKNWRQAVAQAVNSPEIEPFFSPHSLIWQELALQGKSAFALLFSPGNTRTADSLSFEILEELTLLSRGFLPIMGGGAADDWQMKANYSLWGQRAYVDSVLVAVFETQLRFGIAMAHGYHPSSRRGTVTHSHNHEVLEIRGEPAAEAYCRLHNFSREALEGKHLTHTTKQPMGMLDPYGQYRLNVASYFTDEGGVRFAQPTPEGTILTVMEANQDSQIAAGAEALRKALLRGAITDPGMALVFSCAVRRRVLGKRIGEEINGIKDLIPGVPVVGFYSFGEQSQSDYGVNRHNNVVIGVLTLSREFSFGAQVALENEQLRLNLEQRTADLMVTNRKLLSEIGVRHLAEEELSKSHRELQKTVQQLEQSRNLLQLIIESIPIRVFWKDLDCRFLGCNTLFARDAGLSSPEQLLGQDDFAMGWEEQARLYRADDRQVMESGRPKMNIVEPQTTPTGDKIWLNTSKTPLLRPNGEVFGVLGVYEDITERKQAEKALEEQLNFLQTLIDTIPNPIFYKDVSGKYSGCNLAFEKYIGLSKQDIIGKTVFDVSPPELATKYNEMDQALFQQSGEQVYESAVRYADGSLHQVVFNKATFFKTNGSVGGLVGVILDITERKQAEEALHQAHETLRATLDAAPVAIFDLDTEGRVKNLWNPTAEEMLGWRRDEVLGQFLPSVPEESKEEFAVFLKHIKSGRPILGKDVMRRRKDGSRIEYSFYAAPEYDDEGKVIGNIAVLMDITERKRNEEELLQAQEEWERTFNTIPALIMILDNQHRIVKANHAMAHAFGYSAEEMVGKLCYQVVHGSEVPPAFCAHSRLLSHGYAEPREIWLEEIQSHLHVSVTPLYDRSGRLLGSVHVANDITERKLAEEALRKSEEEYRLLVGQIPAVVFKGYVDWGVNCFDDKIEILTGYPKEDFNSRHVIWRDLIPEEELPYVKRVFRKALRGDRSFIREHRIRRKDGSYAWVQSRGQIFCNAQGKVEYVSGVTFDITERKQAEESLRRREAVLEAVSLAAERFLKTDFWEANLIDILGQLGQAMEVSRVYIFENHQGEDGTLLTSQRFEWVAPGIAPEMDNPDMQNFPLHTGGMGRFVDIMSRGDIVHGNIKDFPAEEQAILVPQEIKSLLNAPIFVEDYWWGLIGFDDCLREREWAAVEIEALKTAANMLGAAILHSQSQKALRESEKRLRALSYQLLDVQENERKRLALELHDVLGHDLLNLKLKLESFRDEVLPEQANYKRDLTKIIHALRDSVKNVRLLYQDLIPADLEEMGLTAALENMLEEFALAKRVTWQAQLDRNIDTLFDLALQTNTYRLIQEGLTNIGKHADATHIFLRAQKDQKEVTLILEDNGIGFNLSEVRAHKKTMGLLSMEKRLEPWGGSLEIQSQPKQGTRICVTIPIFKRKVT
jgi:PAS domain S-box-containing protein